MSDNLLLPQDRRTEGREARLARVSLACVNRHAAEGAGATVVNTGKGGLQVTTDAELKVGDVLRLSFEESGIGEIAAVVIWVRKNKTRILGDFTAGLVFRPVNQPGVTRLLATRADLAG
jgi:hypothetical protein